MSCEPVLSRTDQDKLTSFPMTPQQELSSPETLCRPFWRTAGKEESMIAGQGVDAARTLAPPESSGRKGAWQGVGRVHSEQEC